MSSDYLTSENMNMMQRLLLTAREHPRNHDRESIAARLLIERFRQGTTGEGDLQNILSRHMERLEAKDDKPSEFTLGRVLKRLLQLVHLQGNQSSDVAVAARLRPRLDEARRRREDDTDGSRRRQNEVKSRNQMH